MRLLRRLQPLQIIAERKSFMPLNVTRIREANVKIKEAATKLNLSARAIRFYEAKGLIAPGKREHNHYREFGEREIWRLQTIIALREAGMSIGGIRSALRTIDEADKQELRYYLELQRSVLFAKWLETKQAIESLDDMIASVQREDRLPVEAIYRLAEGSKRLREQRSSWRDQWNYDTLAKLHDLRVADAASPEFKDYEEALELTVEWLSPVTGENGLDIGTGTGNLAGRLMARGAVMAGVDQSKEMLKQCARKFPGMETKLGNFLAIPYLESRFDFAVSSFAFRHLTEDQQVLAIHEMRRVLKPHGRICITDLMTAESPHKHPDSVGKAYPVLPDLLRLFGELGYAAKHRRINELLHVVYAVPAP